MEIQSEFERETRVPQPGRGADWWLARAGAALTVVAVILLYQYAVGHGWITPLVRVLTGVAIGAGLMYWGRKMPAAGTEEAHPVGLRELMMGSALAAWFIASFAAFVIYLAVIGGLGLVLYLMRGWQSVLWITFFSLIGSISAATSIVLFRNPHHLSGGASLPLSDVGRLSMSLLLIAATAAFTRAVSLRRELVATGSDRYPEPIRSKFAKHWLTESGRNFKLLSPAAGALDSLSLWVITLAAPLGGVALMSSLWPSVSKFAWGSILLVMAMIAYRLCASSSNENAELSHLEGAAFVVLGISGIIAMSRAVVPFGDNGDALALSLAMVAAIGAMIGLTETRFIAGRIAGRVIALVPLLFVLLNELVQTGFVENTHDRLRVAITLAELTVIGAGFVAWRELVRTSAPREMQNLVAVLTYAVFLLVDARVLDQIWTPLVSATFAIAGTALLFLSRKTDDKLQRAVGGATLALVVFRLFVVDLAGVDTIWRVFLFLGIGALFLFTSRQLQNDRARAAPEST